MSDPCKIVVRCLLIKGLFGCHIGRWQWIVSLINLVPLKHIFGSHQYELVTISQTEGAKNICSQILLA